MEEKLQRNICRFPEDFMFQLTKDELINLKSQFVTSSWGGIVFCCYRKVIRVKGYTLTFVEIIAIWSTYLTKILPLFRSEHLPMYHLIKVHS